MGPKRPQAGGQARNGVPCYTLAPKNITHGVGHEHGLSQQLPRSWLPRSPRPGAARFRRAEQAKEPGSRKNKCIYVENRPAYTSICAPNPSPPNYARPLILESSPRQLRHLRQNTCTLRLTKRAENKAFVPFLSRATTSPEGQLGHALASGTANMGSPRKPTKPVPGLSKDDPRNHKAVNLSVAGQGSNECSVSHSTKC